MKIGLISFEDGIIACGFRRMASFIEQINPDTTTYYVSTNFQHSFTSHLLTRYGGVVQDEMFDRIAEPLSKCDLVGLSSMTGYAGVARGVARKIKERSPKTLIVWGGIHPIIEPEDAIQADVDVICTGEGEFAFYDLYKALMEGREYSTLTNFWFKKGETITKNPFRPLMTAEEMRSLPFPKYAGREFIFHPTEGFKPVDTNDYLQSNGLGYCTIWSIGCPFHCTYCGNTKFIANDPTYKRIRHPGARFIVDEVKAVRAKHPHVNTINFHDDSFMALPVPDLMEFAELWKKELDMNFAVYGVIPNYVKEEKLEILTWAGLNRVRMGIQSGSQRILDFYRRPTPIAKIVDGAAALSKFKKYHIPPAFDIIVDNPVEETDDVRDSLKLIYQLARPYILYIYSLRIIPNTQLAQQMKDRGVEMPSINAYYHDLNPTFANCLLYMLTFYKPPEKLFHYLLRFAHPIKDAPKTFPILMFGLRLIYLLKKGYDHLRFMDFSVIPGKLGYYFWKTGFIGFWHRHINAKAPQPAAMQEFIVSGHAPRSVAAARSL